MRTTLRIDDQILRRAKKIAAEEGRTLASVIDELLREALARRGRRRAGTPAALPTYRGRGLRAGVDLDDSAGLLEWMEGGGAAD